MDPFEEFELHTWYPNESFFEMAFESINKRGGTIGISNACCVLKRNVWEKIKYDENTESLEDSLWAYQVARLGYTLVYSNKFSVYHSHPFDAEYVYRKWYWRVFESLRFYHHYVKNSESRLRRFVKFIRNRIAYREYVSFLLLKERGRVVQFLKKYPFISARDIEVYQQIKKLAFLNCYGDYFLNKQQHYWSLNIPDIVMDLQGQLSKISCHLDINYKNLGAIRNGDFSSIGEYLLPL
jgi:GT2 family glycosyltransferase